MEPIHHRLPVILPKKQEDSWINPDEMNIEKLLPLLQPYPSDEMEMYQVPKEANNARNDYPEVIEPI
jgi:putative SOS response-associated peptidase YedK